MAVDDLAIIRGRLRLAKRVTALTGAGISADSGVPTFRGPEGLWKTYRPEDLATPGAFRRDPNLVWEWYDWRRRIIATKSPNLGHTALVRMEETHAGFRLITQNVDGLHSLAGSKRLIEMHGNIWKARCTRCGEVSDNREVPLQIPPNCRRCGGLLRPHIVWFGESLDPSELETCYEWLRDAEILLVIGTSGVVQPAASFAQMARGSGAYVVAVNPEESAAQADMDLHLRGRAADILPKLIQAA